MFPLARKPLLAFDSLFHILTLATEFRKDLRYIHGFYPMPAVSGLLQPMSVQPEDAEYALPRLEFAAGLEDVAVARTAILVVVRAVCPLLSPNDAVIRSARLFARRGVPSSAPQAPQ